MLYVRNHKLQFGKQVGKWHKITDDSRIIEGHPTDCGRHHLKDGDKVTTRKPKNLTPVISCGVCFDRSDWT